MASTSKGKVILVAMTNPFYLPGGAVKRSHCTVVRIGVSTLSGYHSVHLAARQLGVQMSSPIFKPMAIRGLQLKNRLVRSSIGGRSAYYDGTINPSWTSFEKRFAEGGVAAIISATVTVDDERWSPLEYPSISNDRYIAPFKSAIGEIKDAALRATGEPCRYIMQIGDPGSHTQTSLFDQDGDAASASHTFDLLYGYRNVSYKMGKAAIRQVVRNFSDAARRVQKAGCDGVEVTASKGYLIQQFLNPATNRRSDRYGGSVDNRFRLLAETIEEVRRRIDKHPRDDFVLGVRLSARDFNWLPFPNLRLPMSFRGNGLEEAVYYAQKLEGLGVDYLHIDSGFGFINPKGNPGAFPIDELKMFANSVRHLSGKAAARAALFNLLPSSLARLLAVGWTWNPDKVTQGENAKYARAIRQAVRIPVIANGGFRDQARIEEVLADGDCDLVALARALLSNPRLPQVFAGRPDLAKPPCTFCNKCAARTALFPLGCYEMRRFRAPRLSEQEARQKMEDAISELAQP
jgi:2,4-dienoyl-CoA reductase-like NADH-dependent reductase (Old Yellow Enzyme family)